MDKLIKATAKDGDIRIIAVDSKELVQEAVNIHKLKPTGAALLGRMLTMGTIMGSMLKKEEHMLTLQIKGGGPSLGTLVTASGDNTVKGYINNPDIDIDLKENGKLDVSGAVGKEGSLTVIIDQGLKEPYVSSSPIVSGEIAEDFAYYYAVSEQTPTAVNLGVLVTPDMKIEAAGGIFIQLMPGADPLLGDLITYRIEEIPPLSTLLKEGKSIEDIINMLFDDMDVKFNEEVEPRYKCNCSRDKVEKALISIGEKDLREIYDENKSETIVCHFCNKEYEFTHEDIGKLIGIKA